MRYIVALLLLVSLTAGAHDRDSIIPTKAFTIVSAEKRITLSFNDLSKYKIAAIGDVKIMNHRGELKSTIKDVKGVLLKDIIDSGFLNINKSKEYSEYYILLTASDHYKNVYSWNEIYNTDIGNHIYIITAKDGKPADATNDCILVMSLADMNTGRRHLRNLARIDIKRVD